MSTTDETPALEVPGKHEPGQAPKPTDVAAESAETDAEQQDAAAEPDIVAGLTAADVIDGSRGYFADDIEALLGIPARKAIDAMKNGVVKLYMPHRFKYPHQKMSGDALLRWIESEQIPYEVTELAQRCYRAENPERSPREQAPPLIDELREHLARKAAEAQRAKREAQAEMWNQYVNVLSRGDSPEEGDCVKLVGLLDGLELTIDQVQRDQLTVALAIKVSDRVAANEAEGHSSQRERLQLNDLAAQHSPLFEKTADGPRLRGQHQPAKA